MCSFVALGDFVIPTALASGWVWCGVPNRTCIPIYSTELINLNRFIFSAKLIELIHFLFWVSWLVTVSIRFHKVSDWVDWLCGTGMIESIELIQNIPRSSTKSDILQKKVKEIDSCPKKVNIYIELTDWFDWSIWVIVLTWLSRFICT